MPATLAACKRVVPKGSSSSASVGNGYLMHLSSWRTPSSESNLPSDVYLSFCHLQEGGAATGSNSSASVGNSCLVHLATLRTVSFNPTLVHPPFYLAACRRVVPPREAPLVHLLATAAWCKCDTICGASCISYEYVMSRVHAVGWLLAGGWVSQRQHL
jgi:hypothetical protein